MLDFKKKRVLFKSVIEWRDVELTSIHFVVKYNNKQYKIKPFENMIINENIMISYYDLLEYVDM
jgi:hypothetical protein